VALVGDLPAYWGLGEGGFAGGFAAGGLGHGWEGGFYFGGFSPDRDFLHGVVVGDGGLVEAVGGGGWGEGVDAGDLAVAVAEAGGEASAGGGDGVTAGVDAHLFRLFEEEGFDERVHLFGGVFVGGLEGEAGIGEEAVGVFEEVGVEALSEVLWGGGGLAGGAACGEGEGGESEKGEGRGCECGLSLNEFHCFSCRAKNLKSRACEPSRFSGQS
jgi:hypothetical protein